MNYEFSLLSEHPEGKRDQRELQWEVRTNETGDLSALTGQGGTHSASAKGLPCHLLADFQKRMQN